MTRPRKIIRNVATGAAISLGVAASLAMAGLAMDPKAPARPLTHISERFEQVDWRHLPKPETFIARDGETLRYRRYPTGGSRVVLALHGSGGSGKALHPTARALQQAGYTVVVPDLRGHGASGTRGDVSYVGQVEDDLDDLRAAVSELSVARELHLVGFSMGGGVAIRYAAGRTGLGSVTLLSPYLAYDAPPMQAHNPYAPDMPWASPAVPRIIALNVLNAIGVTAFNHLPVVALATDPKKRQDTVAAYTFRLMRSVNPGNWRAELANIKSPVAILAGTQDELHHAPAYAQVASFSRQARLILVAGVDHMGLTLSVDGAQAVVDAVGGH